MIHQPKIKIKKLFDDVKTPIQGTSGAVGYDVFAYRVLPTDELMEMAGAKHWHEVAGLVGYGTGLAFEPPPGFYLIARSRSSIFKTGLVLSNGVGTIDPDYRGEVKFIFYHYAGVTFRPYWNGDRIGQIILARDYQPDIVEVDKLS